MPAEVTVNTTGTDALTYGATCAEHLSFRRQGLTLRHATNSVAKHNREEHPEPVLNLSAAARVVADRCAEDPRKGGACLAMWQALTGLPEGQANDYLDAVLAEPAEVLVYVAPF